MILKKLTPNLMVDDVNRTIVFFKDILGFELVMTIPEKGQFDWAMMRCGNVEMMFQSRASLITEIPALKDRETGGSLTFYIDVEDVKELYAHICTLKDNVTVVQDLHTTFYGTQEFSIKDYNGFILSFAERA